MDTAEQIRKHLPRNPEETVPIIDRYCQFYQDLFRDVRNYEYFKYLHLGLIAPIKKKSFPEISKVVNISSQSLHHFVSCSPWSKSVLEMRRLEYIITVIGSEEIIVVIDETGDRKKGNKTDYTARQYLGNIGKVDRGIVSVNAYGLYENIAFPLMTKIFKPQGTLKKDDKYRTKPELAVEIINYLVKLGLRIKLVLADSLYGESSHFIEGLINNNLDYLVSIRSNHGVWMSEKESIRANKWFEFERIFSDGKKEKRYIREIIYGKRRKITYWQITTDREKMPENGTSFVMTNLRGSRTNLKKTIGNLYGGRTWVEYGFRQCKQELGWNDYRLITGEDIEKWWEIINSIYWMISLKTKPLTVLGEKEEKKTQREDNLRPEIKKQLREFSSWKNSLINYQVLVQPIIIFCSLLPWLNIIKNENLWRGFNSLLMCANYYMDYFHSG